MRRRRHSRTAPDQDLCQPVHGPTASDAGNCRVLQPQTSSFVYFAWHMPLGYTVGRYDIVVTVYSPTGVAVGRHAAPVLYQ